ncbi:MAG: 5-amino-6-(5-phosphoribosylamino)uracil reductase [Burkholderia sp.]
MSERPYIFCHMETSVDGKIMGKYMGTEASAGAGAAFYRIAFGPNRVYKHQGWLSGRVTTDDNFTMYAKPALIKNSPEVPAGDYVARKTGMYYVSIDPSGRLGWKSRTLRYGSTVADVIEVLTERATNDYKAFLRRLGISYIIAGKESYDYGLMLSKLKNKFGIEMLMLGGGAVLNWSFIQKGLCDEVSVVVAPAADGSVKTQTLFMEREGLSDDTPVTFRLLDVQRAEGDSVWLRYKVNNAK